MGSRSPYWKRQIFGERGTHCKVQRLSSVSCATRPQQLLRWATVWPQRHKPKSAGLLCPFPWGELGPDLTQCGLGRGLLPYQVASWSIQPFGHNRHGPKIGGCAPVLEGEAGSLSNTMWPGWRPTSMTSFILIHPTVWSQTGRQTDGRDRHDKLTDRQTTNGLIAYCRTNLFTNCRPKI